MNDYQFGNFVCELREQKGLTQADVAEALGVTAAAVSKWETGASKPRVEVLFALAKLLDVRPEELIAGKRLQESVPEPMAVEQIYERYEALCRADASNATSTRFLRLFAALLDWWLFGGVTLIGMTVLTAVTKSITSHELSTHPLFILAFLALFLFFTVGFMMRDVIFGGRSLGKRILGLVVLDKKSGKKPKFWQRAVRNLFLQVYAFDAILLLASGATLGDRCARTMVVPKKELARLQRERDEQDPIKSINAYKSPKKSYAVWVIPVVAVLLVIVMLFGYVWVSLATMFQRIERSEDYDVVYELSYDYVINSDTFAAREYDADDVSVAAYTYSEDAGHEDESVQKRSTFEYRIRLFNALTVTCHKKDGEWYVCPECTEFQ